MSGLKRWSRREKRTARGTYGRIESQIDPLRGRHRWRDSQPDRRMDGLMLGGKEWRISRQQDKEITG